MFAFFEGGESLKEAYEQAAIAMGDYMTDLNTVNLEKVAVLEINADDLPSLLYQWLDEVLFLFCADPFLVTKVMSGHLYVKINSTNAGLSSRDRM